MKTTITIRVNGEARSVDVLPTETLLLVLREKLGLKSPKCGCDRGDCGTCTVLLTGDSVRSCLIFAIEADFGESIYINEAIQEAFQQGGGTVVVPSGTYLVGSIQLKSNVTLHLERDPQTPKITAVRDHIQQVMLNLTMNAIQASAEGGVVAIRVFRDRGELGGICLEFSDSGPGIPEENLERIFDPFFSTKGPDQGTGLGLMICHRLVADHDGAIEVSSREGEGATLRVRLPVGSGEGFGGI